MSGSKAFAVAGISQAGVSGTAIAAGLATAGTVVAGVVVAGVVVGMAGKAIQAYQERKRKEQEALEQRERDIQRKIAEIRAQIGSISSESKVPVKLPTYVASTSQVQAAAAKDAHKRINDLKSRLPKIHSEYQVLINQQLLDSQTVQQALQRTEEALNTNNLGSAEAYLQALDDARIQVVQQIRDRWLAQIEYIQERLDGLRDRLPQAVTQELQASIDHASNNWQQLSDTDIEALHQKISAFEAQADQIQTAAENLVASWLQVGYSARVLGIENGDIVVEVETHEEANTQMRIQFYGQQIDLEGPHDREEKSCAERTMEAMRLFQEQGYQLEWTEWDGKPVAEEWPHLYSVPSQEITNTQPVQEISETQAATEIDRRSQRRRETQGY